MAQPNQRESFEGFIEQAPEVDSALEPTEPPEPRGLKRLVVALTSASRWRLYFYTSYGLTSWSARMEEFATPMLLLGVFPSTLFYVAVLGFVTTGSAILFGQAVGRAIDRFPRLTAVRSSILLQKLAIVLVSVLTFSLFRINPHSTSGSACFALVVLSSALLRLANMGNSISLERDWPAVASGGVSSNLTALNTSIRRIDLLSKVLAPLLVSAVLVLQPEYAILLLVIWNAVSLPFEWFFIGHVYRVVPGLSAPKELELELSKRAAHWTWVFDASHHGRHLKNGVARFYTDWKAYVKHPVLLPSLAVAMLYFTVLSFGGITITFLADAGVTTPQIALFRGLGVVAGILATLTEHTFIKYLGLLRAGLLGFWGESLMLVPVVACVFLFTPNLGSGIPAAASQVYPLLAFLALSRFFLWTADLSIDAQLIQEMTSSHSRGRITGVHGSVCSALEMLQYIVVAIWSDPRTFGGLAGASLGSVAGGAVLVTVWMVWKSRGREEGWWKPVDEGGQVEGASN